ncbi:uncharacterized protein TRIVIDRAFT_201347 [Trichoderma virens Gv29-8]|uniref:Adenylyl cyclase-associated protein n=1 Tax=Hypocrea virens (strain Gv29-8 / FGSC 10586) TaxID=413071 RepID=G9MT43_HYPVG|nr:uncharacterized protein TRIVIDRAFT_201347 [Trichoderma virens Gv29-8]EHK23085.1 hypothetical protein TRIVIDRAFT_201347 [Trichoderma virens Gv29-8]
MYSPLSTLLKRLDAVTSQLEDITTAIEKSRNALQITNVDPHLPTSAKLLHTDEAGHLRPLPTSIAAFDRFLEQSVGPYVKLSGDLGGSVAQQATNVLLCFQEQRKILLMAALHTKSDGASWADQLSPMNEAAARVLELQENSHGDSMHANLSCAADGIAVLDWIRIEIRAFRHVDAFLGHAQYFGNKVLKEHKGRNQKQVDWVMSYYQIFRDLSDIVREHFPFGINWQLDA